LSALSNTRLAKQQIRQNAKDRQGEDHCNPSDARRRITVRAQQCPNDESDLHGDMNPDQHAKTPSYAEASNLGFGQQ
jgi:hypothetical protein